MDKKTVPKIIHKMWLDKKEMDNEGPPEGKTNPIYKKYIRSWKKNNPNHEYMFWNRRKIEHIFNLPVAKPYRDFYFNTLDKHIEKCDFSRYLILYLYGGIYVDLDFECVKEMDSIIHDRELGLVWEPMEIANGTTVANEFMASSPKHPLFLEFMNWIMKHYSRKKGVIYNTGPSAFGKFVSELNLPKESFIDCCYVIPYLPGKRLCKQCKGRESDVFSKTFWNQGSGWQSLLKVNDKVTVNKKTVKTIGSVILLSILLGLIILFLCRKHQK